MFNIVKFIVGCLISLPISAQKNITICNPEEDLQSCIDTSKINRISLTEGIYNTSGIHISSNITFIIPKNSVLRFGDDVELDSNMFGGKANSVLSSIGTKDALVENVHIIVDGVIDGNKNIHTYEKGGAEAIDWKWVRNSSISGSGLIHSANGDGIDLDATYNSNISDVTIQNNGGSGVHFGSPRPIVGSKGNVVMNITSINNGYKSKKNGFDLSWPNPDGAIFINCRAIDNYRNFQMEAYGGAIYNSESINNGTVVEQDDFKGADYVFINGKNVTQKSILSRKTQILLKRDLYKLLGKGYPSYLESLTY